MLQDEPLKELQQQLQEQSWENALGYLESEMLEHIKLPEKCKQILSSSINSCYFIYRIERLLQKDEYKVLKPNNTNNTNNENENENDNELYACELKVSTNHIYICIPFIEKSIRINYDEPNTIYIICNENNIPHKRGGNKTDKIDEIILEAIHEFEKVFEPIHNPANTCEYVFTRGRNKGKICEGNVLNDGTKGSDKYCCRCINKPSVLKEFRRTYQYPISPFNFYTTSNY